VGILFVIFLIGTAGFVVAALGPEAGRSPRPTDLTAVASPGGPSTAPSVDAGASNGSPPTSGDPATSTAPGASPSPDPGASADPGASPSPSGSPDILMPIVPVVDFWSKDPGLTRDELIDALEGRSERYESVLISDRDGDAVAAALGITIDASVRSADPGTIREAVRDGALGLVRATDVTPLVRALPLDERELFGNDRVGMNADWPLTITATEADAAWDQASTFTVVAGGDSVMDRGVYDRVIRRDKGIDYPFDGGTLEITGRYCCGTFTGLGEHRVPQYRKTGNVGIVRELMQDADISMINLENPVPDDWSFHLEGTRFSGRPALLEIFTRAGIDWAGLANNHIYDYGPGGIADTLKHLDRFGIDHAGAGMDLDEARQYSVLEAGPGRVAILPCLTLTPIVWARPTRAGAMPCSDRQMVADIREAEGQAGAVIVFPSWGPEYRSTPFQSQRRLAERWIEAGADVVVGFGHHMVAGMQDFDDRLVFYSIGNFVFDQDWAEFTMQGILPEMTFHDGQLVQVEMNPILTIDRAQPNLLDPAGDGQSVLRRVRNASEGSLEP
jgi:poly-gamma-glutamate capsule biosynthesis protein CapA/YwtB (metallophosphatase superfamily)